MQRTHGFPGSPASPAQASDRPAAKVGVACIYDQVPRRRILVDRLWPRGLSRSEAPFDTWAKDVAPSAALRKWYGHVPERFEEFARRYRQELATGPPRDALEQLRQRASQSDLVLLTAT